jgi:hypothetical protein
MIITSFSTIGSIDLMAVPAYPGRIPKVNFPTATVEVDAALIKIYAYLETKQERKGEPEK